MIDIHSKHDNMHKSGMFYALICINDHIISCIICMLSLIQGVLQPFNVRDIEKCVGCIKGKNTPTTGKGSS